MLIPTDLERTNLLSWSSMTKSCCQEVHVNRSFDGNGGTALSRVTSLLKHQSVKSSPEALANQCAQAVS